MKNFKLFSLVLGLLISTILPLKASGGCDITELVIKNLAMEPCGGAGMDTYYKLRINIKGVDLPATVNKVVIGGDTYSGDDVEILDATSTKVKIRVLVRSRGRAAVDVFVESESGCTDTYEDALADMGGEPVCDNNPCDITNVYDVRVVAYDCGDGTFRVRSTVAGVGLPDKMAKVFVTYNGTEYKFYDRNLNANNRVRSADIPIGPGGTVTKVFIEAESGCTWTYTGSVDVDPCIAPRLTSLNGENLTVFPNPSKGQFRVLVNEIENPVLTIFNTVGQQVYRSNINKGIPMDVNTTELEPGLYIVSVSNGIDRITKKVIIE